MWVKASCVPRAIDLDRCDMGYFCVRRKLMLQGQVSSVAARKAERDGPQ